MFATENQFFPSTEALGTKVYNAANIKDKQSVLDPTAGNGVLLDIVSKRKSKWDKVQTYAIEIDQELRFILQGKGHKVIGTDFLTYCEPMEFDRIIMNPPFRIGAEMTLKAWSHLKDGGRLVAILNAETLRNAYSGDRQALANLLQQYGESQELGQAFKDAARRSNVEVIMITLDKPERVRSFDFDASSFSHNEVSAEEFKSNPLAHTDVIKNLVAKYKACELALKERSEIDSKLDFYLGGVSDRVFDPDVHRDDRINIQSTPGLSDALHELKSRFWNTVFEKTELGKKTTSSFAKKFMDFARSQSLMEFSEENIKEVLSMFFLNREQIMDDCIGEVFDKATSYHEKNCIHHEGWKTNKSYKLSKRIIYPDCVSFHRLLGLQYYGYNHNFLGDLDRVLCWLSGTSQDSPEFISTDRAIAKFCHSDRPITEKFESTFFTIRIFKKGTAHLDFKDLYLLDDFNLAAAKSKKWIGADY